LSSLPGGIQLADDVAQEICIAVHAALPRYRDRGKPFEAFVYGIAARKVADAMRALHRHPIPTEDLPDSPDGRPTPEDQAVLASQVASATALLDQLPAQLREIMLLRVAAGFSAEETGAALGMTAGAVRVAQHRALTKMRQLAASAVGVEQ
jgi:RNA polymerase sigma-70 factor (ECF subfamily)